MTALRRLGCGCIVTTIVTCSTMASAEDAARGELLFLRALALQARGDAPEASRTFDRACHAGSAEACLHLAAAAAEAGDDEETEEYLQSAREAAPVLPQEEGQTLEVVLELD